LDLSLLKKAVGFIFKVFKCF